MQDIVILGAGDFAQELAWVAGILDPTLVADYGEGSKRFDDLKAGTKYLLGVGSPQLRKSFAIRANALGLKMAGPIICDGATVASSAVLGDGTVIMPGAIVSVHAHLGTGVLMNFNSVAGHHSSIGDYSVLDPGAKVGGRAILSDEVEIGTNASVLPKITIDSGSTLSIGSCAINPASRDSLVMGVPGRRIK